MANFATHLNVSAFVSGISAISISYSHLSSSKDAVFYFLAGIIGGILPDIDHDKSTPIRIIQFFFSNLVAFFVVFKYVHKYPILNLLLIWVISYIIMSVFFFFFKKLTKHRGMIHSIPAGLIFWFLISIISYNFFHIEIIKSYFLGFFVFIGYMTHLILDEIYSVDITGKKIKKSFGSALKICSNDKKLNLITYLLLLFIFIFLPKKDILFYLIKGIGNV